MNVIHTLAVAVAATLVASPAGLAVTLGQIDTFEDGTTQGWLVGLLGAAHPAPPRNASTGGPGGADDNFMVLTSVGGAAAGSRLSAINFSGQWAGDYTAAGITSISMDVKNLGSTDLALRLLIADPAVGPPENIAFWSESFLVPAGSDWTSILFPIAAGNLTAALGEIETALANATELRIFHSTDPLVPGEPIIAQFGVDNIRAAVAVPEPDGSWMAMWLGCAFLGFGRMIAKLYTGRAWAARGQAGNNAHYEIPDLRIDKVEWDPWSKAGRAVVVRPALVARTSLSAGIDGL